MRGECIKDHLPDAVLVALAKAVGFSVAVNLDLDTLTLTRGDRSFTGSLTSTCAFLQGYAAMRLEAVQALQDLERSSRDAFAAARSYLDGAPR